MGRVAILMSGTPLLDANARAAVPKTSRGADSHHNCPTVLQVIESTPHCRTRIYYVVDDGNTLAPKSLAKWSRNPISSTEKAAISRSRNALGICELGV